MLLCIFYCYFRFKYDLLFVDYDVGLYWFCVVLDVRLVDELIIDFV